MGLPAAGAVVAAGEAEDLSEQVKRRLLQEDVDKDAQIKVDVDGDGQNDDNHVRNGDGRDDGGGGDDTLAAAAGLEEGAVTARKRSSSSVGNAAAPVAQKRRSRGRADRARPKRLRQRQGAGEGAASGAAGAQAGADLEEAAAARDEAAGEAAGPGATSGPEAPAIAAAAAGQRLAVGGPRQPGQQEQQQQQKKKKPRVSTAQAVLRMVFYSWVSTYNLVAISSLWARCADVFSETGTRLFGFISAGATLGQLCGSVVALALTSRSGAAAGEHAAAAARGPAAAPAPGSSQLVLMSSALLLVASQLAPRIRLHAAPGSAAPDRGATDPGGGPARGAPAPALRRRHSGSGAALPLVAGASLPEDSNGPHLQPQARPDKLFSGAGGAGPAASPFPAAAQGQSVIEPDGAAAAVAAAAAGEAVPVRSVLTDLVAGFRLILASEYLLLVCAYLLITYVVGSLLYFERALVVSKTMTGAGERTTFFAWLNSWSATLIALCQLFATAGLLRVLGVPLALASGPAVCLAGLALVALRPSPSTIAGVEVVRKVVGYAVIRPAREVLFTVVSRTEKYSAKLVIDMVVQRLGDSIAAAAFQLLDVQLQLGVGGVAIAGCATCGAWLVAAVRLGRVHVRLAQERQRHEDGRRQKQDV
ncbi:hypothetical protein MNEG_9090 [Monoraphidium neglectum]|uniref:ADP,ATP carrier protein n=1 Tax=Monoraphidium neglectum TaxID=145388 RepID=A0A0D2KTU2_9CHLO|nr:hypothetical protein MNEG_9090 [Monoraphidium neglectum]KIY98873.1 hypothetical protein MNEG_9090 [Monoraphidium neglectum]|eukprot:XP_013897893.1 hypothetical protein MNEG_9090 [Monoraphidium neglectum]